MNNRPARHTPRAPWHRYEDATYFITICTSNRAHSFGTIRNGEVHLSALGECLRREIEDVQTHYPYAEIPLYVIMPNHVHLIVAIDSAKNGNICNMDAMNRVRTEQTAENLNTTNNELDNCNNHRETAYNTPDNNADVRTRFIASQGDDCNMDAMNRVHTKHGGATGDKNPMLCKTLGTVVRGLKARVSHYAKQNGIEFAWHGRYHDHIIRNNTDMNNIANYIVNNPANWELDCYFMNEQ